MASVRSVSLVAVLATMGIVASVSSPAQAADLGGNCCADLEERIAELEATTARKGNRKVSLEISGHVNESVLYWDDGFEDNIGVYTNDNARTRFRFKGDAKIDKDWKAGYLLEVGVRGGNSKRFTQDDDNGLGGLDLRHSVWYLDSKTYGRVWVGLTGGAGESVTEVNLAATKDIAKYSDVEDSGLGLSLRQSNGLFTNGTGVVASGDISWRRLISDDGDQAGEGRRSNIIRYDTPTWNGFVGTVNFGEDDLWEVGARYAGEFGGFKLAAGIAYGETNESDTYPGGAANQVGFFCPTRTQVTGEPAPGAGDADCEQLGGSVSVMHVDSGLYANFAAGYRKDNNIEIEFNNVGIAGVDDTTEFYAVEVGIEKKWMPFGKTTFYGQYYVNEGGANARNFTTVGRLLESELESVGVGVIQGIDAAAMHLYLTYRHSEADVLTQNRGELEIEDLDVVMSGAIIRF